MSYTNRDYTWPAKQYGSLVNIDTDALAYFSNQIDWDYTDLEKKCVDYFGKYINSGISDIIYNIGGNVPNGTEDWAGARFLATEENGMPVDYSQNKAKRASYEIYCKTDVDPYAIWLDLAWKNRMRPWLSFRMNDVHYANTPVGHSSFFYRAKENGWMVGDYHSPNSWYGYAMDYSVPEVRQNFLAPIAEQTQRYDAFGIDLDFHRTIRCFKNDDPANMQYMTAFMREVDAIRKQAERKWGHPWRVMIRFCQTVDRARLYGFDVQTYIREHLVDAFVPASYWGSTDSAIPIAEWKDICPKDIPVFWGIESNTVNMWHWVTPDTVAGYRIIADVAGADGLYQYNTFGAPWAWKFGTVEAAMQEPVRRFLTTMNDIPVPNYPEYEPHYLPVKVTDEAPASHSIAVGKLKAVEDVLVFVGIKPEAEAATSLRVFCSGVECEPLGKTGLSYMETHYPEVYEREKNGRYPWRIYTYRVPAAQRDRIGEVAELTFVSPIACEICYAEIANGILEER